MGSRLLGVGVLLCVSCGGRVGYLSGDGGEGDGANSSGSAGADGDALGNGAAAAASALMSCDGIAIDVATPCVYTETESESSGPPAEAGAPRSLDGWFRLRASEVGEGSRFVAMDTEYILVDSGPASSRFRVIQPDWEGVQVDWPVDSSQLPEGSMPVDICRVGPLDSSRVFTRERSTAGVRVLACSENDCVILAREPGDAGFALLPTPELPALGVRGGIACSEGELCVYGQGGLWCLGAGTWEPTISLPGGAIQEAALGWGFVPSFALSTVGELWVSFGGQMTRENAAGESGVRVLQWSSRGLVIASAAGEVFLNYDFLADLTWDSICLGASQAIAMSAQYTSLSGPGSVLLVDSGGAFYSRVDENGTNRCVFDERLPVPLVDPTALFGAYAFLVTESEVFGLW